MEGRIKSCHLWFIPQRILGLVSAVTLENVVRLYTGYMHLIILQAV